MVDKSVMGIPKDIIDINAFRESIQQVTSQLEQIRSSFYQGVEEIERIKKILNSEHIGRFSDIITEYETQLTRMEKERNEAIENARKYSQELEKEKERLIKLWDAYKLQEDELNERDRRIAELERKVKEYENKLRETEKDLSSRIETLTRKLEEKENLLKEYSDFRKKHNLYEERNRKLHEEIENLRNTLNEKEREITQLKQMVDELSKYREFEDYKTKYEKLNIEFNKERERLLKLYKLYEDLERENNKLREELNGWRQWYESNAELLDRLFKSTEDIKKKLSSTK
ncbi:MAG: hypothetical protein FE037_02745 [Thermoplasmata archaeon]|nr:MAG: hypothetical protein FE042_05280 [Thermoplasmata archaeon]KAA0014939.1 MAG: hypothetical protein FE037_02745 [Thermoplasmata archaeon]